MLLLSVFAEKKARDQLNEATYTLFLKKPGMAGKIYEKIEESVLPTVLGLTGLTWKGGKSALRYHASLQVTRKEGRTSEPSGH